MGKEVKDVTITMTTTMDGCFVDTDDGRHYELLDDDDREKFCEDFPKRSAEFITSMDYHERTLFAEWHKNAPER